MKYIAEIDVMPKKALLDPQGKAVTSGLKKMGFSSVESVRIGKHIQMELEAEDSDSAGVYGDDYRTSQIKTSLKLDKPYPLLFSLLAASF